VLVAEHELPPIPQRDIRPVLEEFVDGIPFWPVLCDLLNQK
jgi:hypothetical protein